MTQVVLGQNKGVELALRRFKREVSKAGIFQDMRKKRHFETLIEKEKRKAIASTSNVVINILASVNKSKQICLSI